VVLNQAITLVPSEAITLKRFGDHAAARVSECRTNAMSEKESSDIGAGYASVVDEKTHGRALEVI
jgi:hypothetical protein